MDTTTCIECQGTPGSSPAKCACCRAYRAGWSGGLRRAALLAVAFAGGLAFALFRPAPPSKPAPAAVSPGALAGAWSGTWTTPEGFLYDGSTRFAPRPDGTLDTRIRWTLRRSPRAEEQIKLGLSGDELVRGRWDGEVLRLEGHALDDPHHILGKDQYRLVLSDDGRALGGMTWDHGTWNGACHLKRTN